MKTVSLRIKTKVREKPLRGRGEQMAEYSVDAKFDDQPFTPTTVENARVSGGLVWWRPDGVISETPELDVCLVKQG